MVGHRRTRSNVLMEVLKMGENYMAIVNSTESLDFLNDLEVWGLWNTVSMCNVLPLHQHSM